MWSLRSKLVALVAVAGLWAGVAVAFDARAWDSSPLNTAVVRHSHFCGEGDLPEPGLQGQVPKADQTSGRAKQGYNCGLAKVGYTALDKVVTADGTPTGDTRPNANANMAWAGACAYVAGSASSLFNPPVVSTPPSPGSPGGPGIAVVDVHDAANPKMVRVLRMPGGVATAETIGSMTRQSDGMAVLVVGQYGNDPVSNPKPMDIYVYDTADPDCSHLYHVPNATDPVNKATYEWPGNIHNLTVSKDGNYVWATIPAQAIDISGMWANYKDPHAADAQHIRYVGNLNEAIPGTPFAVGPQNDIAPQAGTATHPEVTSHEIAVTDDNSTVYMGAQTANGELMTIVDVSQWLHGGKAAVYSQTAGRAHSMRQATIGPDKVPYLLHSEEAVFGTAYGCIPQAANPFAGPAQPWLTDISDLTKPVLVSQMGLEINQPENCKTQADDGENDSVHYHDVDDPKNTTFAMASMWNAGIRVFDVRDPKLPTEVAYFNAADVAPAGQPTALDHAWGHIRYDAAHGNLWFASAIGGFYVVRLEDHVRSHLGLPPGAPVPSSQLHAGTDVGWPGTKGITYGLPVRGTDTSAWYCTLAPYTSAVPARRVTSN